MKSRLGTSWVVGTPISKGGVPLVLLRHIRHGSLRGLRATGGLRPGGSLGDRGAKGLFGASSTRTVLDSRVEPRSRVCFRPSPDS